MVSQSRSRVSLFRTAMTNAMIAKADRFEREESRTRRLGIRPPNRTSPCQEPRNISVTQSTRAESKQMTRCRTSNAGLLTWISLISAWTLTATCHAQQDARQSTSLVVAAEELSAPSEPRDVSETTSYAKLAGLFEGLGAY